MTEASSGYQALEYLKAGLKADVLITDYAMPGMTGADLAREALALQPDLQVLLITGYATVGDEVADGLTRLAKPFRQARLAAIVDELLRRNGT